MYYYILIYSCDYGKEYCFLRATLYISGAKDIKSVYIFSLQQFRGFETEITDGLGCDQLTVNMCA